MKLINVGKAIKKALKIESKDLYDYSTPENAQATALYLFDYSKMKRSEQEEKWLLYQDYYEGEHHVAREVSAYLQSQGIPFAPAALQDPFVHVESQIIPDIPAFEFAGRDDDLDGMKAKQREYVVQYVLDKNQTNKKNPRNERRLGKYGNAFWKVYWDASIDVKGSVIGGDVVVIDVGVENIFPDPSATVLDDCEYINYAYPMHIRATKRKWAKELKDRNINLSTMNRNLDTEIFASDTQDVFDDTVQVIEHWYRDDEGDISCVILINDQLVKHIEKYWIETGKQNKRYPFVKYCKIEDEANFWDVSEMHNIIDLVDAAERELAYGILNATMTSNDIIVVEENALSDGQQMSNAPGAMVNVKDGKINSVRRLGGLNPMLNHVPSIQFYQDQIERTIGNFDTSMGVEPARVTTASGIAQINERADSRKSIKKAPRTAGFEDLFKLIDWTCLEFYTDERMIYIGAKGKPQQPVAMGNLDLEKGPVVFNYSSNRMKADNYYPEVDCTVIASDALTNSKALSIQTIADLSKTPITPDNYKLIISYLELVNLPRTKEITDMLEQKFNQPQMPVEQAQEEAQPNMQGLSEQEIQAILQNPELLNDL